MKKALALFAAMQITIAHAAEVIIVGNGSYSCASWVEDQRGNDEVLKLTNGAWVDGYLSSYNQNSGDHVSLPDSAARIAWITTYCRKHMLDGIADAAFEFASELQRRQASH
jgi:hypothetical protein